MDGYLTVREIAEKWNMSIRNVQNLCSAGKIEGVTKFGQAWVIPETAEKPLDGRVTSGSYRNWRKKPKEQQVSGNQKIDTFLIPFLLKLTKMKQKDTGKIPQNKRFCNDKQPETRMKSLSLSSTTCSGTPSIIPKGQKNQPEQKSEKQKKRKRKGTPFSFNQELCVTAWLLFFCFLFHKKENRKNEQKVKRKSQKKVKDIFKKPDFTENTQYFALF